MVSLYFLNYNIIRTFLIMVAKLIMFTLVKNLGKIKITINTKNWNKLCQEAYALPNQIKAGFRNFK